MSSERRHAVSKAKSINLCAFGLSLAICSASAFAQSDEAPNTIKVGYADITFNTKSGDLAGPPGMTPAGIQAGLRDAHTMALVYERHISGPWSVVLQAGAPPTVTIDGAGTGAALGSIGSAKAWFPALLATYTFSGLPGVRPYVGAGVNYAFYTDKQVTPAYTAAFGGTSSTSTLKNSWGPVIKIGAEFPLGKNWLIDVGYTRYWIKTTATITTATPGLGDVARTVNVKANPHAIGVAVGYRF